MTSLSYRSICSLVWPLALGMANNALMQFADRVFLAHESAASLEAVLPASMLAILFTGFFQSIVAYSGTFAAQYHGAGDAAGSVRSLRAGLMLAAAGGVLLALSLPAGAAALRLGGHPPDILERELSYYRIVTAGGVASCATIALQGYFTGLGRTGTVFWVNLLGNALNIALDPVLIFGCWRLPGFGISGAAAATVASQAFQAAALAFLAAGPARSAAASGSGWFAPETMRLARRIIRFGVPNGVYCTLNILSFTVFVFVTGKIGEMEFAASNAAFSVNYLLIAPIEGFAVGAGTLVGRCQGARDSAGAALAGRRVLLLAEAYVVLASLAVLLFHRPILGLFASADAPFAMRDFVSLGFALFVLMTAWQMFDAADVVLSGALKGAGDTHFVMVWMLVCAFALWMPLVFAVYALVPSMQALWGTMVVYVAVICAGTYARWRFGPWRRIRLV